VVHFLEGKDEHTCRARTLVNAAGPWVGTVLERITPRPAVLTVDLVQGAHIIVENKTRHGIYYLEAPQDGRAVFIMPWQEHTLVGTTETPFDGDPAAVSARPEEVAYLQETLRRYFPGHRGKLLSSFAGLRVLPHGSGAAFHRLRETILHPDNPDRVARYRLRRKLTGYRATAARMCTAEKTCLPCAARRYIRNQSSPERCALSICGLKQVYSGWQIASTLLRTHWRKSSFSAHARPLVSPALLAENDAK
jgi:glycerol-3-phosphate dehydrogenase